MTDQYPDSARAKVQAKKALQDQFIVSPLVLVRDFHADPSTLYFRSNNFLQNTLSRLVGWYPNLEDWRRIIVDAQGRLEVSTIQASYDNQDTKSGNAPNAFGAEIAFDDIVKRLDVFVWDFDALIAITPDGVAWHDNIEVPANTILNMDATAHGVNIMNKVAGSIARYQFIGWW